jgi:hypothetical protein
MTFENRDIKRDENGDLICPSCHEGRLQTIKIFCENDSIATDDYECDYCSKEFKGNDKDNNLI